MSEQERVPQHNIAAEQAILGAVMLTDRALTDVEPLVKASDFYRPVHGEIYTALTELRDRGEPTDPIALSAYLAGKDKLARVGGAAYLHTCYSAVPSAANAGYYAKIVAGCSALRKLATCAARINQLVTSASHEDADAILERARDWLADIDTGAPDDSLKLWSDAAPRMMDAIEQASQHDDGPPGVPTGLVDVDDALGGLRPGQLILVAARPGVGKSVMLINLAQHAAMRLKLRVALFTLEMSEVEVSLRIASAGTGVPLANLRTGNLDDIQWSKLIRFVADTDDAPLHIDETPRATLAHFRAGVKRTIAQHGGLDLVIVDYLQLAESGGRENRQEQIAALSRGLKLLAKEFGVPVVAASQLNRNPEHRADKRPQTSDLRESGSLEQDADVVILLHREDVNDPESPKAGECDVIIGKNRHGRMDTITVAAQLHLSRFVSMALDGQTYQLERAA